jgi:hypothetical protein
LKRKLGIGIHFSYDTLICYKKISLCMKLSEFPDT